MSERRAPDLAARPEQAGGGAAPRIAARILTDNNSQTGGLVLANVRKCAAHRIPRSVGLIVFRTGCPRVFIQTLCLTTQGLDGDPVYLLDEFL